MPKYSNSLYVRGVTIGYVYEGLGSRLYRDEWIGLEIAYIQKPLPENPENLPLKKAALEYEKDQLFTQTRDLEAVIEKIPIGKRRRAMQDALAAHREELNEFRLQLEDLENIEIQRKNYALVSRAHHVAQKLLSELDRGYLKSYGAESGLIQGNCWIDESFARIDWRRSLIYYSSLMRKSQHLSYDLVLLERDKVDEWLMQFEEPNSAEDWCEQRIKQLVINNDVPTSKKQLKATLQEQRVDLTGKAFDRVWMKCAPDFWKRKGRKISPNNTKTR